MYYPKGRKLYPKAILNYLIEHRKATIQEVAEAQRVGDKIKASMEAKAMKNQVLVWQAAKPSGQVEKH